MNNVKSVKRYWDNPYLTRLDTQISMVKGDLVWLQETILYPFAGGQEADMGTIGGYAVLETLSEKQNICYRLAGSHTLQGEDRVTVVVDWQRRYRLMRLHLAAELILELVYSSCDGIEKIGAHIGVQKARLDFLWPHPVTKLLPELMAQAQQLIAADHPVKSAFSEPATERRYWEIEGFARVSCGGTHLRRSGEIGALHLKRKNIGHGKERIEIIVDERPAPIPDI